VQIVYDYLINNANREKYQLIALVPLRISHASRTIVIIRAMTANTSMVRNQSPWMRWATTAAMVAGRNSMGSSRNHAAKMTVNRNVKPRQGASLYSKNWKRPEEIVHHKK